MPTYIYTCESLGKSIEVQASMDDIPELVERDGEVFARDIRAEHCGQKSGDPWTDHESLALMVHPADIKKNQKEALAKGCGVIEFSKEGLPRFRSNSQRRKYLKAYGYVDRASYY